MNVRYLAREMGEPAPSTRARRIAARDSADPDVLEHASVDENEWVRGAVAANVASPASALERLAQDEVWKVREAVARNLAAPAGARAVLARDVMGRVRAALAETTSDGSVLEALGEDVSLWEHLAGNVNASAGLLWRLAERSWLHERIARNAGAPPELLAHLFKERHRSPEVVRRVMENPAASDDLRDRAARRHAELAS